MTDFDDDSVGYGRPPKTTRFQKGSSGNPTGRPKKMPSLKAELARELQQPRAYSENGKSWQGTNLRAFVKSLVAAAIDCDGRAVAALLSAIRQYGIGTDEETSEVDVEDLELLQAYVDAERARRKQEAPSATTSDDSDSNE
jgi:hypothetical protein